MSTAEPNLSLPDSVKLIQFGLAHKDELLSIVAKGQDAVTAFSAGDYQTEWSDIKSLGDTVLALQLAWKAFDAPVVAASAHADLHAQFEAAFDPRKLGDGKILGILQGIVKGLGGVQGIIGIITTIIGLVPKA